MGAQKVFREVGSSLVEHASRVWRRGWTGIVSGVGGVLGLISLTVPSPKGGQPLIPAWLWLTLLVGGIMVAQFLAFHDVRKERDSVKAEMATRFNSLRYRLELSSLIGRMGTAYSESEPPVNSYRFQLVFFNGGLEVLEYEIESVFIQVGGVTATPEEGPTSTVGTIILPGRESFFFYRDILAPIPTGLPPEGHCELVIRYGHPTGGQWFRVRHEFKIAWESANGIPLAHMLTRTKPTHELAEVRP